MDQYRLTMSHQPERVKERDRTVEDYTNECKHPLD